MKYYAGIGSRDTPEEVLGTMRTIAGIMQRRKYWLRSGGAPGADTAFEMGAGRNKEIYLPWANFNNHPSGIVIKGDEWYAAARLSAEFHPAWHKLSRGGRMLHTRNVFQVLGPNLNTPAKLVICWTKDARLVGGTAQALRIAMDDRWEIPIFNLARGRQEVDRLMEWLDGQEE